MVETLAEFASKLNFTLPRSVGAFQFEEVYTRWASFESRAMSAGGLLPAAAVLPDRIVYDDSSFVPNELEDTWSGGDPSLCDPFGEKIYPIGDGTGDGFVLFEVCQATLPILLMYRGKSRPQAKAIAKRLEEVFIEDGGIIPDPTSLSKDIPVPDATAQPVRYGVNLTATRYYDRKVRFTLIAQQLLDAAISAQENRWLGQLELEAHMQVCVVRRGRAMKPRTELVVDGEPEGR
jgi:hypothetical protein